MLRISTKPFCTLTRGIIASQFSNTRSFGFALKIFNRSPKTSPLTSTERTLTGSTSIVPTTSSPEIQNPEPKIVQKPRLSIEVVVKLLTGGVLSKMQESSNSSIEEEVSLSILLTGEQLKTELKNHQPNTSLIRYLKNLALTQIDKLEILNNWAQKNPIFVLKSIDSIPELDSSFKTEVILNVLKNLFINHGVNNAELRTYIEKSSHDNKDVLIKNIDTIIYQEIEKYVESKQCDNPEILLGLIVFQKFADTKHTVDLIKTLCSSNPKLDKNMLDERMLKDIIPSLDKNFQEGLRFNWGVFMGRIKMGSLSSLR